MPIAPFSTVMNKFLPFALVLFVAAGSVESCQPTEAGVGPDPCATNPSDPKCGPTRTPTGKVKLRADAYKGNKKCAAAAKCPAYADSNDSIEVRGTAYRLDTKTKKEVPAKDQKLRFSVELPKGWEGDSPLRLEGCTCPCTTGEDGVAKATVKSSYKTGVEMPIKVEMINSCDDVKVATSAKATVQFREPAPRVTVTLLDSNQQEKMLIKRASNEEASIKAVVQYGTTTPPTGASVQFKVDNPAAAKLSPATENSTTLAASLGVSLDSTGTAYAKLKPVTSTSTTNDFVRVDVVAAFGTTSATGYAHIAVGTGPAIVLSADKSVADADGSSAIQLKAGVVDQAGARVSGATVRFETEAGIFQNRSKSYEAPTDSTGVAQASLISFQPSSGAVKATVVSTLTGCEAGKCASQKVTATFIGTALSCDVSGISNIELSYESCPAGPEVTPCRVQNDDDPTDTPEIKENEVIILGRALDTTSKPLSNVVIRFCTCVPHRVETSTGGTVAATDGAGLARITFKAGFQPETTSVLAYVGCPNTDPCEEVCGGGGGEDFAATELREKQIPVIVTSSSGYTIEFDDSPIVIGVLGTGKDTADIKLVVKDKFGTPVKDKTEVRFYLVKGGGGETLPSEADQKGTESFQETIDGKAKALLRSGTVPGNVQVAADVSIPGGKVISAMTQNIIIQAGPPVTDHFGIARTPVNIIGFILFGVKVDVTAFAGDRYGNPPTPGTSIFFATEAGIVEGGGGKEIDSVTGSVTAQHISAEPFPRVIGGVDNDFMDARTTIVAYTKGSEGFLDVDGDGLYLEDTGCIPGRQCASVVPATSCTSTTSACTVDPAESNGCWDPCEDKGAKPRNGTCEDDEFTCDDANRDGNCSTEEAALPKICRLGEDIFCMLCTGTCGSGVKLPVDGFSKLRHKDSAGRDITKMPDKACSGILHDIGEPFINYDESVLGDALYAGRDLEEIFFDLNANGSYDPPNGKFDISNAPVWEDTRVLWSDVLNLGVTNGQYNTFNIQCVPRTAVTPCTSGCTANNTEFLLADKCGADFIIYLADWRGNPVVGGCSLTVTFPSGSSTTGGGGATGCTNPTQTAPSFSIPDCSVPGYGCTLLSFSFNDPDICTASTTTIDAVITADLTGCKNLGPSGSGKVSTSIKGRYQ